MRLEKESSSQTKLFKQMQLNIRVATHGANKSERLMSRSNNGSKRTENNRTVADVAMSCCKIVIGFYQVIAGIFSALARVQWPVTLISVGKYLKLVEGNILQFAPLSCIHSQLRPDPFLQFVLAVGTNILVVSLILLYLVLKKEHINKMEIFMREKSMKISSLRKSCYRNIFLFIFFLSIFPLRNPESLNLIGC